MSDQVVITTSGPAPDSLVTEQEYAEREAARPPAPPVVTAPVQDIGATTVRTEAELRSALLKPTPINVVGDIQITQAETLKYAVPGTLIFGAGKHHARISTKVANYNNVSHYVCARDITIRDITLDAGFHTSHCVYGDCFNNVSGLTLENVRIQNTIDGLKYVGDIHYPPCVDLTFRNSEVLNYKGKAVWLDVDLLNPVIEGFLLKGFGTRESHTAIWMGQGILGGRVCNGRIENSGYNGLEIFYAHCYPIKSQLSRDNPHGPGMLISGIEMDGVANIACSLAGVKRSVISDIHIRNAGSGVEYIDEIVEQDGKPLWSDYNASNVTVAGITGVGITVHRMKRGRFSNHIVSGCGSFGVQIYDGADGITFTDSTISRCADRMLFCNGAPNTVITGNEFLKVPGDPALFGFYAFGGSHIFQNNILRDGLKSGLQQATVMTAPGVSAIVTGATFTDYHNHRFP